jgi:hypothetical protein
MCLVIPILFEVALQRNALREGHAQVPEHSLRKMAEIIEAPDGQFYPWENASLVVDAEGIDSLEG